jgi:hypothetical protein
MPIPAVISDLSPIIGTGPSPNGGQPGGGENPSTFDDYLRAYGAFIAQLRAGSGFANSGANRIPFFDASGNWASSADFVRDASGNVGVGTSGFAFAAAGRGLVEVNGTSSSMVALKSGDVARAYLAANSSVTELASQTNPVSFTVNGAERMRIDASGHQINTPGSTTPPTLTVNGQLNITPTSNTNVRISFRGTDGVTRVANITLA